jgi:hypothetical protein
MDNLAQDLLTIKPSGSWMALPVNRCSRANQNTRSSKTSILDPPLLNSADCLNFTNYDVFSSKVIYNLQHLASLLDDALPHKSDG